MANFTPSWDLGSVDLTFIQGRGKWMLKLSSCFCVDLWLQSQFLVVLECPCWCWQQGLRPGLEGPVVGVVYIRQLHYSVLSKWSFLFLTVQHHYVGEGSCLAGRKLDHFVTLLAYGYLSLTQPHSISTLAPLLSSLSLLGVCVLGPWYCHFISGVLCFWDLAAGKTFGICKWPLFVVWSQSCLVLCLSQYSTVLASV